MSIDDELERRARDLAAQQKNKAARLERDADEFQAQRLEALESAKVARSAHDNLLLFSPRLGTDLRCPEW